MNNPTIPSYLQIELLSDTTFSRGEGTAGVVDTEIEYDAYGMPFIGGKTVRGLLRDSWLSMSTHFPHLHDAAVRVLGHSHNTSLYETCRLRIGDAVLPEPIQQTIRTAVDRKQNPLTPDSVLSAFTTIRYQTAEDRQTGAPETTTLRSSRVVLRGFLFQSPLSWLEGYQPKTEDQKLLALCSLSTRHGGLLRNRGRGHLRITMDGNLTQTQQWLQDMQSDATEEAKP